MFELSVLSPLVSEVRGEVVEADASAVATLLVPFVFCADPPVSSEADFPSMLLMPSRFGNPVIPESIMGNMAARLLAARLLASGGSPIRPAVSCRDCKLWRFCWKACRLVRSIPGRRPLASSGLRLSAVAAVLVAPAPVAAPVAAPAAAAAAALAIGFLGRRPRLLTSSGTMGPVKILSNILSGR